MRHSGKPQEGIVYVARAAAESKAGQWALARNARVAQDPPLVLTGLPRRPVPIDLASTGLQMCGKFTEHASGAVSVTSVHRHAHVKMLLMDENRRNVMPMGHVEPIMTYGR